ncbi:MAG TPA: hypothetical protein IAB70_01080 [Candidatus Merdicola faecigallinarum]|uniref:Uncharacterized protein n=1 Tax=Candidatus Merdicola faecigallinarum TaxID=2840862 RepID=A0A9D1M060_9FIRM|nr:hypothetical protein [Candidatus Merdicola faecigallinarum]
MKRLKSKVFWLILGMVLMYLVLEFNLIGKIPSPDWQGIWNWITSNAIPLIIGVVIGVVGSSLYQSFKGGVSTVKLPRRKKDTNAGQTQTENQTQGQGNDTRRSRR